MMIKIAEARELKEKDIFILGNNILKVLSAHENKSTITIETKTLTGKCQHRLRLLREDDVILILKPND